MPFEFNSDQFICNALNDDLQGGMSQFQKNLPDNLNGLPDNLKENCKLMLEFDEKRRAELSYIDATNVQQRTWLHIANLVIGSLILAYATKKVI